MVRWSLVKHPMFVLSPVGAHKEIKLFMVSGLCLTVSCLNQNRKSPNKITVMFQKQPGNL